MGNGELKKWRTYGIGENWEIEKWRKIAKMGNIENRENGVMGTLEKMGGDIGQLGKKRNGANRKWSN